MKAGFLLNHYKKKKKKNKNNKNSLKNLMKKLPTDLTKMIVDYKYKFDHNEKMLILNKEFEEKRYWCSCCDSDKFETICPITFVCLSCKVQRCIDCEDCHHYDEENELCDDCVLNYSVIPYIENLIGKK